MTGASRRFGDDSTVTYRDECLLRLNVAQARMDDALLRVPDANALHVLWQRVLRDLARERPPAHDQIWLADRLLDLKLHVHNSARWRQSVEDVDTARQPHRQD